MARLILQLLLEERFPRVWVPSGENRDLRQLLWARGGWNNSCSGGIAAGVEAGSTIQYRNLT